MKKKYDRFGICWNPCISVTRSKINSKCKKLKDADIELLNVLVNTFENEVLSVLKNEKYYSKETIDSYKKLEESVHRLQEMIEVGTDGNINLIKKSW